MKQDISTVLDKMLITKQFEIENRDIVRQALCDYRHGRGDIADYLIGRTNRSHGCDFTATFDRSLKDSPFCLSRLLLEAATELNMANDETAQFLEQYRKLL